MSQAAAEPVRLLVLGDSLTAGFGLAQSDGFQARLLTALAAKGVQVRLLDGAVSGDTTAGGLARLDWVLAGGPDGGGLGQGRESSAQRCCPERSAALRRSHRHGRRG